MTPPLPALLYFSDVFAESSYSGALLIYRLLETYPSDRLFVIESSHARSTPARRLRGVTYAGVDAGNGRWATSRLHAWWSLWMTLRAASWAEQVPRVLDGFAPQAVLTVVHGHAWAAAAAFAEQQRVPLHLIVHDDWPRMIALPAPFTSRIDAQLAPVYRSAASRLCVSPWMQEEFDRRYGGRGEVLYPSRSRSTQTFPGPPERPAARTGLSVAYAGSIRGAESFRLLGRIARVLQPSGGRVVVFGPVTADRVAAEGITEPNICLQGLVDPPDLAARLRAEADVLLLPIPFAPNDAANSRVAFPSKLADYTAAGLPLLICGPGYSSAVRWALAYPGVAEVVESPEPDALATALRRLEQPALRDALARRALDVGAQLFSHEAAWSTLTTALTAARSSVT